MSYIDITKENIECDKIAYQTFKDVQEAIKAVSKKNKQHLYGYQCKECGLYHKATAGKRKYKRHKKDKYEHEEIFVHVPTGKKTKAGNQKTKEYQVTVKK